MTCATRIVNAWTSNAAAILEVRPESAEGGEPYAPESRAR